MHILDSFVSPCSLASFMYDQVLSPRASIRVKATTRGIFAVTMCFAVGLLGACSHPTVSDEYASDPKTSGTPVDHPESMAPGSSNPQNAAAYLDRREVWWMGWKGAARDHQTFCVSCHTGVPYALSRPVLGKVLAEQAPSVNERKLLDNVSKRVRLWREIGTFYTDQCEGTSKTAQSRGTESVLNALILASYD